METPRCSHCAATSPTAKPARTIFGVAPLCTPCLNGYRRELVAAIDEFYAREAAVRAGPTIHDARRGAA